MFTEKNFAGNKIQTAACLKGKQGYIEEQAFVFAIIHEFRSLSDYLLVRREQKESERETNT